MEFSSEQFRQIINALKGQHYEMGDQRKHLRAAVGAHVRIIRAGRKIKEIILRDISPGGVGMISQEPFRVKERFIIRLPHAGETPQFVLCAVCHCREAEPHLFVIGARFISISEFKENHPHEFDSAPSDQPAKGAPSLA